MEHGCTIVTALRPCSHLEEVPEVGTAGAEQHAVSSETPALRCKGDVHQLLTVQQRLERVDDVRLEVVPSQAELLLRLVRVTG